MRAPSALPIDAAMPALRGALREHRSAVVQAPPGAGKTTRVPLALLAEPWRAQEDRTIVMLEPRRLAARAAARFMARQLGEEVGATVGYRVRLDTRVGPRTRIEVVTEGVLGRMLLEDPALEQVALVIFDEFHERSVHADAGLALCLQSRELLRPDLRLMVMSATLDGAPVAALLGGAPLVRSEGRTFVVETRWRPRRSQERVEAAVAAAVREALRVDDGDVLAFLPGQGEIARTCALLEEGMLPSHVRVQPLYGNLSPGEQDAAVAPAAPGTRKVVLATSVAETSLTIEGVRVVVDSGLARLSRFSPRSGMSRLETVRVSRASADQRRGRAGRTAPGVCYRLWSEAEEAQLLPYAPPEIVEADLAPLALDLAMGGVRDPAELRWLDPPPPAAFAQARELLAALGALDHEGRVTTHGRAMSALAAHPRLAHMLLRATEMDEGALACDIAALLGERDPVRAEAAVADADLRLRLQLLRDRDALAGAGYARGHRVDGETLRRVRQQAAEWRRQLRIESRSADDAMAGVLLALAYPDRIGQRRPGTPGRFLLRNGRGAALPAAQPLSSAAWLVAAELDDRQRESRIFLAAPVELPELLEQFGDQIEREELIEWDDGAGGVRARRIERLGAIVLRDVPITEPDEERVQRVLLDGVRRRGLQALPWSPDVERLRARLRFLHARDAAWPDVSDDALASRLEEWLSPALAGVRRLDDLRPGAVHDALRSLLSWERARELDRLAPTHVTVPTGSRIPIDYGDPASPVLAVRLQELFGLTETPAIAGGAVPLTLHLLSPAHRPLQVTRDLAGFWRGSYQDVRREMKGRYPRHHWPDDPLGAQPTRRAKRRGAADTP